MTLYHTKDPQRYPRDGKKAFYMSESDYLKAIENAAGNAETVNAVYHSHVGAGAYFSQMDREFAEHDRDTAETRLFEAIDSMSEGFAIWASDDRLVMCNSRYLAGFEKLSDILVPGVHFADFLEAAVERGVYDPGDLSVDDFIR